MQGFKFNDNCYKLSYPYVDEDVYDEDDGNLMLEKQEIREEVSTKQEADIQTQDTDVQTQEIDVQTSKTGVQTGDRILKEEVLLNNLNFLNVLTFLIMCKGWIK